MNELTEEQKEILGNCRECDGIEVHKDDWHIIEPLETQGLCQLGPARGPEKAWRRMDLCVPVLCTSSAPAKSDLNP